MEGYINNHKQPATFINRCLKKKFKISWPIIISNEELWRHAQQKPLAMQIKLWKLKRAGHKPRKDSLATDKQILSWNSQGQHGRGGPRKSWSEQQRK